MIKKISKKKLYIIGIVGTSVLVSAITIPIVISVSNKENEKKDKEDVQSVLKILNNKILTNKILIIESNSTGKIIANNKQKIIKKIQNLIESSNLKGVSIDVAIKNDVNISQLIAHPIIVTIKKGKYSKKLEGKNGLSVKRSLNSQEIKIQKIKTYLKTPSNLNLILPKTSYSNDDNILEAIKLKLINDIEGISSHDSHLIVKKENSSAVTSVAIHSQSSTPYEITFNKEDFILNLNQEEFSKEEKINKIKTYFETPSNLNLILPKINYDNDNSILEAIKVKLVNDIEDISRSDSHLIVKKESSSAVTSVAIHGQASLPYEITIDEEDFTLNLNQEEFSKEEKIQKIKTYLKTSGNSNIILPKTTYSTDDSILEAIKVKLVNDIEGVSRSDSHLIVKKVGSNEVTSVVAHDATNPTPYEITIDEEDFTLNLNQDQFTNVEKINKIEKYIIKEYDFIFENGVLTTVGGGTLIIPIRNYHTYDDIFNTIKRKIFEDINKEYPNFKEQNFGYMFKNNSERNNLDTTPLIAKGEQGIIYRILFLFNNKYENITLDLYQK
jgi:hypothetical protein